MTMNNYTIMQNNTNQNHMQMKPYPYPIHGQNIILLRTIGQCLKESLHQYEMYLKQNVTAMAQTAQKQLQKASNIHTDAPTNNNEQLSIRKQLNQPHIIHQKKINDKLSRDNNFNPKTKKQKNIQKKPHINSPTMTDDQPLQEQKYDPKPSKKRQLRPSFNDEPTITQNVPELDLPLVSFIDTCNLPTFGMGIQQKISKMEALKDRQIQSWAQKCKLPKVKREIRNLASRLNW